MAGEMTGRLSAMTLRPIGVVKSKIKQPPEPEYDWRGVTSEIAINSNLSQALDGLELYSHIIVIYWLHQADRGKMAVKVHPKGRRELPLVGVFASRFPYRPNPLGQKTVRLLGHKGNVLLVEGLDAIDGTSVVDIKPYIPGYDSAADATVPPWTERR